MFGMLPYKADFSNIFSFVSYRYYIRADVVKNDFCRSSKGLQPAVCVCLMLPR